MRKLALLVMAGMLAVWSGPVSAIQEREQSRQQPPEKQKENAKVQASGSASASADAKAGRNSASLESGTTFEAVLTKNVDTKKCKEGDRVEAKTTKDVKSNGQVVIPKNSKLLGRVTEAKARGEGHSESSLGMVFEKAVTKDGREIPLNVAIQALAASQSAAGAMAEEPIMMAPSPRTSSGPSGGSTSSGGLVGGVTSTAGATLGATTSAAGGVANSAGGTLGSATNATGALGRSTGQLDASGALTSTSQGVIGLRGLTLVSDTNGVAQQGSRITSSSGNVRLDSGTRMLLRSMASTNP